MNVKRWIARREADWKQLEALLSRVEKRGLRSLSTEEIKNLASLYRSTSGDLARARTYQTLVGNSIVQNLQQLTSRSFSQIYQGVQRQGWKGILNFYRWGFPAIVQQTIGVILLSTAIFLVGALVGWWFAWRDPAFLDLFVPGHIIRMVRDEHELWMGSILGTEPVAASNLMTHNISVSFNIIAGGVTLGALTVFLMFINGLNIGAIGTLVTQNNLGYPFWAFVFPHGSLEIPALCFAGAAGLLIARGILFPGQLRRIDALKFYGNQAGQLVFGIIPMLIIAGTLEGFFSPNPIFPEPLRYFVGISLFAGFIAYLTRKKPAESIR